MVVGSLTAYPQTPAPESPSSIAAPVVRTKLMLDSIDARLLKQPSLVNVRKRAPLPVVRERTQLADAVARYLAALGLERRVKPVTPLHEYLASRAPVTLKSDKKDCASVG
jgi:hypothetical protein